MLSIAEVKSLTDIRRVSDLANKTWNTHYLDIIGQQQVDYMLSNFQSGSAIAKQISHGIHYFLVKKAGLAVAYFSIEFSSDSSSAQLSKLYVISEQQRKGLGHRIICFIESFCTDHNAQKLWLTVNKNNSTAINFYHSVGFEIIDSCITDIGSGFVMDDLIMQKLIT